MKKRLVKKTKKPTLRGGQNKKPTNEEKLLSEIVSQNGKSITKKADLFSLKEPEWLIDGFLTSNSIAMIYATQSSGKSLFALHLAVFLLEQGKIARADYYDGDNDLSILKKRNGARILDKFEGKFAYHSKEKFDDVLKKQDLKGNLIIIDSIKNFIKGNLNDNAIIDKIFDDKLKNLRNKGALVLFLHHTKKDSEIYKGASAFAESVDFSYLLHKSEVKGEVLFHLNADKFRHEPNKISIFKMREISLEFTPNSEIEFLESAEFNTLNLVCEILYESKDGLCKGDLAREYLKLKNYNYVAGADDIYGRNKMWSLIETRKGKEIDICEVNSNEIGGIKKTFKFIKFPNAYKMDI